MHRAIEAYPLPEMLSSVTVVDVYLSTAQVPGENLSLVQCVLQAIQSIQIIFASFPCLYFLSFGERKMWRWAAVSEMQTSWPVLCRTNAKAPSGLPSLSTIKDPVQTRSPSTDTQVVLVSHALTASRFSCAGAFRLRTRGVCGSCSGVSTGLKEG